jgi:hypothetical protein
LPRIDRGLSGFRLYGGLESEETDNKRVGSVRRVIRQWLSGAARGAAGIQTRWSPGVQTRAPRADPLWIAYYGFSYVPGLIPIHVPVPGDTIDNRQLAVTSNFLAVASDSWKLSQQKQFTFAGFFRDYNLTLRSNFGDGLIQQSESRTVVGGEVAYIQSVRSCMTLLAGVDLRRDAPRNLDLQRAAEDGIFQPATSNNLTLSFVEPFVSLDGNVGEYVHYDAGLRQEEVRMNNQDLQSQANSFNRMASLSLPKATLTLFPAASGPLPMVAFSYGEGFHTEDPRIGAGTDQPMLLAPSRAYQLRISKVIKQFRFNVTLRRTSNSQELAKLNPDTGLQDFFGPSLNRSIVVSVQRNFSRGAFYISYAQADAASYPDRPTHSRGTAADLGCRRVGESFAVGFPGAWRVRIRQSKALGRWISRRASVRSARSRAKAVHGKSHVIGGEFPARQGIHGPDNRNHSISARPPARLNVSWACH